MGLRFRHYSKKKQPYGWVNAGFGFVIWGSRPTLDIHMHNHVFVFFWKKPEGYGPDCDREQHNKYEFLRCELAMYLYELKSGHELRPILKEIHGRITKFYTGGSTHDRIFSYDKE